MSRVSAVEHRYRYPFPSELAGRGSRATLRLAISSPHADTPRRFFTGTLKDPRRAAAALLTLGATARSRFYVPPAMLARLIREADPIITSDGRRLRFETFSLCCGVYARVDVQPEAIDGDFHGRGTTNVDFGPDLRAALAQLSSGQQLRLAVGSDEVEVRAGHVTAVERKIQLPARWLRCLVEVQSYLSRMDRLFQLRDKDARRFIKDLPKASARGELWVVPSGTGLRLSRRRAKRCVRGKGLERLRVVERLHKDVRGLTVYGDPDGQASAWELDLGDLRLTVALSAEPWRGFSGEGRSLSLLPHATDAAVTKLRARLHWGMMLTEAELLEGRSGLDAKATRGALALLGTEGLVGYDLVAGAYFYRELPFDMDAALAVQPRLRAARDLVAKDGVVIVTGHRASDVVAEVRGSGVVHQVRLGAEGTQCSCPWFASGGGHRGPCKHILATQLLLEGTHA